MGPLEPWGQSSSTQHRPPDPPALLSPPNTAWDVSYLTKTNYLCPQLSPFSREGQLVLQPCHWCHGSPGTAHSSPRLWQQPNKSKSSAALLQEAGFKQSVEKLMYLMYFFFFKQAKESSEQVHHVLLYRKLPTDELHESSRHTGILKSSSHVPGHLIQWQAPCSCSQTNAIVGAQKGKFQVLSNQKGAGSTSEFKRRLYPTALKALIVF